MPTRSYCCRNSYSVGFPNADVTFASVVAMLVVRPVLEVLRYKSQQENNARRDARNFHVGDHDDDGPASLIHSQEESSDALLALSDEDQGHGDGVGDIVVHCFIETIEFVLGSISNTASYLRLWALSLAHRQLSLVFFEMTVGKNLTESTSVIFSTIGIVLGFLQLAVATVGVIMGMDVMECFLHSLRLHW